MNPLHKFDQEIANASDEATRLALLNRYAFALARTGDADAALLKVEEAELLARKLRDDVAQGRALCTRGICRYLHADYIEALQCCMAACATADQHGDQEGLSAALLAAAACHYQMGTLEEAHTALMQALGILEVMPDDGMAFRAHNTLGAILSNKQKYDEAESHFDEAIAIAARMDDEFNLRRALVNRANLHHKIGVALAESGETADAKAYFERAAGVCESMRTRDSEFKALRDVAGCAGTLGEIYVSMERLEEAWVLFDEMLNLGREMNNPHVQAEALMHLGKLHISRGAFLQARDCLDESVKLAAGANTQHLVARAHEGLANWFEARGEFKAALAQYKHYVELHEILLRRELDSTSRARAIWVEYQQARREAETYRARAERLSAKNEELAAQATRFKVDARHDPLTGLANRRGLDEQLIELVAAPSADRFALAIADIDAFKSINDGFTHTLGDAVLKAVADMIRSQCRHADFPARFGGDEFVLCLPGATGEGALQMLERVRENVAGYDWSALDPALKVTLSVGIAERTQSDSVETLMRRADEALYRAKNKGRNRVVLG